MADQCEACKKSLDDADKIVCSGRCKLLFHFACVGYSKSSFRTLPKESKASWTCPACKKIPNVNHGSKVETSDYTKLFLLIEELKNDSEKHKTEVLCELQDVKKSMEFEAAKANEKLHQELKEIKEQNKALLEENQTLKKQIIDMKSDILDLQQYSRRLNVEISNFPETPNETMSEITESFMKILEVDLTENITAAHRVPTTKKGKCKPIIIQFNTTKAKSDFIKSAKAKRITANCINTNFESLPVYVNDHLCPELKKLLFECKVFKRENDFKFCWTKAGKVFLRKSDGSKIYRIKSNFDLTQIPKDPKQ